MTTKKRIRKNSKAASFTIKKSPNVKETKFEFGWKKALHIFAIIALAMSFLSFPASTARAVPPILDPEPNPPLVQSCGLDIALVLDDSLSIGNNLSTMKTAFNGFVNVLIPATPSFFSVTYFNTQAHTLQTLSNNASVVVGAINSVPAANNYTNWQDGLHLAAATLSGSSHPRLIVFASDGQPNRYGNPAPSGGTSWTQVALNAAINEANIIKGGGTRILTLGIGTGGNSIFINNLKAISGPNVNTGITSDVITTNFSTLASDLATLASQLCGGTITATKIFDRDSDLTTTNDQSPAEGWQFTVAGSQETTDQSGKTAAVSVTSIGPWSVVENPNQTQQDNYTFLTASCVNTNHGNAPVGTLNVSDPSHPQVTGIQLTNQDIISCVFYNKPAGGTLHVVKHVINDNEDQFKGNAVASDFIINVDVATSSNAQPFATQSFSGSEDGTPIALPGDSHYFVTETGSQVSNYAVSYEGDCSQGGTGDLPADGSQTCTIVNNDMEPNVGALTVIKHVVNDNGGVAEESDYTLIVAGSVEAIVYNGQAQTFEPGTYIVSESGPQDYTATYSGDCDPVTHQVTLTAGHAAQCIITNDDIAPSLTLVKQLMGNGSAVVTNWTLVATGDQQPPFVLSGAGGASSGLNFQAGTYTLSESGGASDYSAGEWSCTGDVQNSGSQVTLGVGQAVTCTITNTYTGSGGGGEETIVTDPAIVKTVDNNTPAPGATIIYTLVVTNNGNATATNVSVTDPLPATVTYVSNDGGADYNATTTTVTWTIGDMAPSASVTLNVTATVKGDASGIIDNTATVKADQDTNTDPANNSSTKSVTVTPPACTENCGGNGGGSSSTGSGSSSGGSGYYIPPAGLVSGTSTTGSLQMPEVLGAATQLPRTGVPLSMIFVVAVALASLVDRKYKLI
jgi:uncharacterized repeat protein (TIGR01451 family)